MEGCVFDEVRAFLFWWIGVGVVGTGRRVRAAEARSGECYWEFGQSAADGWEGGDGCVVRLEGESCVPAGDVLAEEFAAYGGALFAAEGQGVPVRGDWDVGVVSGADVEVFHCGVAEEGVVGKNVDVDIGDGGRVVCGIGQVHQRRDSQGRLGGVDDAQIEDFRFQLRLDSIARAVAASRDGCYTWLSYLLLSYAYT